MAHGLPRPQVEQQTVWRHAVFLAVVTHQRGGQFGTLGVYAGGGQACGVKAIEIAPCGQRSRVAQGVAAGPGHHIAPGQGRHKGVKFRARAVLHQLGEGGFALRTLCLTQGALAGHHCPGGRLAQAFGRCHAKGVQAHGALRLAHFFQVVLKGLHPLGVLDR